MFNGFLDIWKFNGESYKSGVFAKQPDFFEDDLAQNVTSELLGIPREYVTMTNKGFVLARYWKIVQQQDVENPISATSAILEQELSKAEKVSDVIKLFAKYGTHYLSGYTLGDCIYQVFVYDKDVYDDILKQFPQTEEYLFGFSGVHFRLFTKPRYTVPYTELTFGYSEHVGKVLALSKDPNFEKIRPHLADSAHNVKESIFKFVTNFNTVLMTDAMTKTVKMNLKFDVISSRAITDLSLQHRWDEILMVSTFQKFGKDSSPNFQGVSVKTFSSYMQPFNSDIVTNTATSYTAIIRMNFNLQDLKILNPKFVTDLFIFADVVEINPGTTIQLPGQNSIYIICRKFISHSYSDNVPEISASTDSLEITASTFIGVLRIDKKTKHITIVNGTTFKSVEDSSFANLLTVTSVDTPKVPTPSTLPMLYNSTSSNYRDVWLTRTFVSALELEMASVQSILSIRATAETVKEGESALSWVIDILSSENTTELSPHLETTLGQALLLNKTRQPEYLHSTLLVPRLAFSEYKELYEKMLSLVKTYEGRLAQISAEVSRRKQAEVEAHTQKELNGNILSIGKFLVGQVKVATEHQQDIVGYHENINAMKLDEIELQDEKAQKLLTDLTQKQQEVRDAGDKLKEALKRWRNEQVVREALQVAAVVGTLFSGGAGVAALPASAANIERVAAKVEYVVEVIRQISALYEQGRGIRGNVGKFNRATAFLDRDFVSSTDFPSELEWMDFDTDIGTFTGAAVLPSQVYSEAADFRSAATKLSARGKAYLNVQKNLQALKYEVIVNELQKGVVERQVSRLSELGTTLSQSSLTDHEANTTDLFEIGNILRMRANEIRTKLAQTFITMDAALQYQYLQNPTPLESYDTLGLQEAALKQVTRSVKALEDPRFTPHHLSNPIAYDIPGVRISSLLSGEGFKQRIPLSATEFFDYVRVRIIEIEMNVDSVVMSPDDTVYIEAEASGEVVKDRDFSRTERNFASFPVTYDYVYNFKTGDTQVGNRPAPAFINKFMMMTPFAEWTFRIPNVTLNRDIKFSAQTTTLRLKFHLSIVLEPSARLQQSGTTATLSTLLRNMDSRHVLRSWDAICAMDAAKVNDLWEQKFTHEANNGGFVKDIVTPYVYTSEFRHPALGHFKTYSSLNGTVGPPKLSFIRHNSNSVTLTMYVTRAEVMEKIFTCSDSAGKSTCKHTYNATKKPNIGASTTIVATLELTKIVGLVRNQMEIALDFSNSAIDHKIEGLPSDVDIAIRNALYTYFTASFITEAYVLGTVDFQSLNTPKALQPEKFYFATGGFNGSPDGLGTLYIFIKTNSTGSIADENAARDFSSPLSKDDHVIPAGYTSALFISTRVIFQDILHPQFAKQVPRIPTTAKADTSLPLETPAWILAGASNSQFNVNFDEPSDWVFHVPLSNFKLKGTRTGLRLYWVSNFESEVKYIGIDCPAAFFNLCGWNKKEMEKDLNFHIDFRGLSTPSVDTKSVVTFPAMTFTITFENTDDSSVFKDFLNGDLGKTGIAKKVSKEVSRQLSSLSFNAGSISVFALTNLIFPGAKVIDLRLVYIPGDMVLLGNVTKTYNPNYKS